MMIKPWLIRIVGKTKQYISLQVLANWIGLLANIVVTASVARLLGALYEGSFEEGQLSATLLAALAAVVVRIVCTLAASRMSFLASDEVKRILRERIYRKLCRLGLSYTEKIGTSEAVQIAGEGVDQRQLCLRRKAAALLRLIILSCAGNFWSAGHLIFSHHEGALYAAEFHYGHGRCTEELLESGGAYFSGRGRHDCPAVGGSSRCGSLALFSMWP